MKKLFISLLLLTSCMKAPVPTQEDINNSSNYGNYVVPTKALVSKFLKTRDFYDPNSLELEDCSLEGEKAWIYNPDDHSKFIYGYWASCDVNTKNRVGGYTGFKTVRLFQSKGVILDSENLLFNPQTPVTNLLLGIK